MGSAFTADTTRQVEIATIAARDTTKILICPSLTTKSARPATATRLELCPSSAIKPLDSACASLELQVITILHPIIFWLTKSHQILFLKIIRLPDENCNFSNSFSPEFVISEQSLLLTYKTASGCRWRSTDLGFLQIFISFSFSHSLILPVSGWSVLIWWRLVLLS